MALVKEKVKMGVRGRVREDAASKGTSVGELKVYTDAEASSSVDNLLPPRDAAAPVNKGACQTTASGLKGSSKIADKAKGISFVNQNVRRKALADVSNVKSGSFSRKPLCDGSKPKLSIGESSMMLSLSSKNYSMGKAKECTSQRTGDFPNGIRGARHSRVSLADPRTNTKDPGNKSVISNVRSNARSSMLKMRKSVTVVQKKANQMDTNSAKEGAGRLEKAKRNSVFPVKAQAHKKVVPQVTIGRSHLWKSRVSDGFITMAARDQIKAPSLAPSRKSTRQFPRTAAKGSNNRLTLRSKCTSAPEKSSSLIPSKKTEGSVTSSLVDNIPVVSHEDTRQESKAEGNCKSCSKTSDVIPKAKSKRRRSYTSSLLAGPKLLQENAESSEQLPSIDDNCNQLEVAEYVDEIYQYYWVLEAQSSSLGNYMSIQSEITPQMRGILINWLVEVHSKYELMQETLFLMVTLFDQYLSLIHIKKKEVQLVGLAALLLASKYEDYWHPRIKDLISISAESYTRDHILRMENLILSKLKFRLNVPTPYVFMLRFLKAAQSDQKLEHLAFFLIELSLVEYESLKYKASVLCASAIYVARSTLKIVPAWTPLLTKHTRYEVSQIRDCSEMILKFHNAARTAHLRVTYEKFLSPDLSGVAAIKPLKELPL